MKTLMDREDWQKLNSAMKLIAEKFGTSVYCSQKYEYMNVNFKKEGLRPDEVEALNLIEDIVMKVSDQEP